MIVYDFEYYFGTKMKEYRLLKELSIEQAALEVGVTPRTYKKYELGINKHIRSDKIERIAYVLNCSPADLMGGLNE